MTDSTARRSSSCASRTFGRTTLTSTSSATGTCSSQAVPPDLRDELAGVVLGRDGAANASRTVTASVAAPAPASATSRLNRSRCSTRTDQDVDLLAHRVDPTGRDRDEVGQSATPQRSRPGCVRRADRRTRGTGRDALERLDVIPSGYTRARWGRHRSVRTSTVMLGSSSRAGPWPSGPSACRERRWLGQRRRSGSRRRGFSARSDRRTAGGRPRSPGGAPARAAPPRCRGAEVVYSLSAKQLPPASAASSRVVTDARSELVVAASRCRGRCCRGVEVRGLRVVGLRALSRAAG